MSARITNALEKLFQKHRIIFWYDEDNHLRESFDAVDLDAVEKVEIQNNEFGLKYRLIRQEPDRKFLVYKAGPEPEHKDNWLLDVQLAHTDFRTDKASLWLAELDLPYHFKPIVANHEAFFKRGERRDRLREGVTSTDLLGKEEVVGIERLSADGFLIPSSLFETSARGYFVWVKRCGWPVDNKWSCCVIA